MPLYIKSPVTSQSNLSAGVAGVQKSIRALTASEATKPESTIEVRPLPRFAMVRCGRRKARETLLKHRNANAPDPSTLSQQRPDTNCPQSLIKSKVSLSVLKVLVKDPKREPEPTRPSQKRSTSIHACRTQEQQTDVSLSLASNSKSYHSVLKGRPPQPSPGPNSAREVQCLPQSNPFADEVNKGSIMEAVALLQASAQALFEKLDLHPETLKQIVEWKTSASKIPDEQELGQNFPEPGAKEEPVSTARCLTVVPQLCGTFDKFDFDWANLRPRPSTSTYFPNAATSFPSRPAYKDLNANEAGGLDARLTPVPSTPKFLLDIRESLSNISLVPIVSSTCPSLPSSTKDSTQSDFAESDISDLQIPSRKKQKKKKLQHMNSLPAIRSEMKQLMRTLSNMNAVPEVMDIFIDNLPPVVKISPDHLQRLTSGSRRASPASTAKKVMPAKLWKEPTPDEQRSKTAVIVEGDCCGLPQVKSDEQNYTIEEAAVTLSSKVIGEDTAERTSRRLKARPVTVVPAGVMESDRELAPLPVLRRSGSSHVKVTPSKKDLKGKKSKLGLGKKKSMELGGGSSAAALPKSNSKVLKPKKK